MIIRNVADMMKEHEEKRQRKIANPRWGNWRLDAKTYELIHDQTGYPLDLDRCKDSAQILDWIFQISGKGGGDWDIRNLLRAPP